MENVAQETEKAISGAIKTAQKIIGNISNKFPPEHIKIMGSDSK